MIIAPPSYTLSVTVSVRIQRKRVFANWEPRPEANGTLEQLAITDPFTASNTQTCNNGYDDLARLTSDNCGSTWSQSFSYDAFGNIGKSGTISFQPTYNSATNHYATLPGGTPAYDTNGNVTNDGFYTYNWDAEGKNTQIQGSGAVTYDALGRLAEEPTIGYRQPVYSPMGQQLGDVSQSAYGVSADVWLPLPGGAVADYEPTLYHYLHADWLGTTRLETTPSRTVYQDQAYAPFGEQYVGGGGYERAFTGVAHADQQYDVERFPARQYFKTEGRWISPDPAGLAAVDLTNPQSLNRYAYVNNNPLGLVDPTGMAARPLAAEE
jgi:RHS repeat-associated protein